MFFNLRGVTSNYSDILLGPQKENFFGGFGPTPKRFVYDFKQYIGVRNLYARDSLRVLPV